MTDVFLIAKSIVVHFAHICSYGVETVNLVDISKYYRLLGLTRVIIMVLLLYKKNSTRA